MTTATLNHVPTKQLKEAFLSLYKQTGEYANAAYRIAFDELNARMGDDAFDAFLDANGI